MDCNIDASEACALDKVVKKFQEVIDTNDSQKLIGKMMTREILRNKVKRLTY